NIDSLAFEQHCRSKVVEEDERADHSMTGVGESTADREATEIDAAWNNDQFDGLAGRLVAWGGVLPGKNVMANPCGTRPCRAGQTWWLNSYDSITSIQSPIMATCSWHRFTSTSLAGACPLQRSCARRRFQDINDLPEGKGDSLPTPQLTSSGSVPVALPVAS